MDSGFGEVISPNSLTERECDTGVFECNICFDLAQDPIVTLCGHLYCWPCLYKWLHFHSFANECPVCKSLVREEKLIPIYGRGKSSLDIKSPPALEHLIPSRPAGQRPETAPIPDINNFPQDEVGAMGGFVPTATNRIGNLTRSALFGAIPSIFNFQVNGFHGFHGIHDPAAYGTSTGMPYWFSSSLHGGYAHGFHYQHSIQVQGAKSVLKICFLFLGLLVILLLISISPF